MDTQETGGNGLTDIEAQVLSLAPDSEDARRRFERFVECATDVDLNVSNLDADAILLLRLCCQRAPYLATLLLRDPHRLIRVGTDSYLRRPKTVEMIREELALRVYECEDVTDLDRALRIYRADELVRLGAREMEWGTPFEVGEELSWLADACLDAAIEFHDRKLTMEYGQPTWDDAQGQCHKASLVVIAMGKLGGEELNFCSDVDLIYIYSSDNGSAGDLSLQEYFSKLCRRISASIGDTTEEDSVFRVDLRLRPEGSQGVIANSLISAESYYESYGRPWERQVWLKARPCAGDLGLGAEVMAMMRPFIYPRSVSAGVIDEVRELNQRIKSELGSGAVDTGYDLKNGLGGIREIEFFVQALQLIHAGRRPKLQTRSTIVALDELLFCGLVSEEERLALAEAYRYLRHLEHMVQLESGRQTQRLPTDTAALDRLAKRTQHTNAEDLRIRLAEHTQAVQLLFDTLGQDEPGPPIEVQKLLQNRFDKQEEMDLLALLGFRDTEFSWRQFDYSRRKPLSPFAGAAKGHAAKIAPLLLHEISRSPDPDQALEHTAELISRRGGWSAIWAMMYDNPHLLRLVASVFGTSVYLSKTFINHPEHLDVLLTAGLAKALYTTEELKRELQSRSIPNIADREEQWNALAEFKQSQVLRIGLADIAGAIDPLEVCEQLSAVAELSVQTALALVTDDLQSRYGTPYTEEGQEVHLAVMAMGKLGGRELGYASDLDIVFIFSDVGQSDGNHSLDATTYMTRVAQRLMRGLHSLHPGGRLYEVDTRLRPSGSKGLLVSSLAAWSRYHRDSRLWEKQALTKLRCVAGDTQLGDLASQLAENSIYDQREPNRREIADGIKSMRNRIWRELVAPQQRIDLKAGHGGLIDIEFTAQYLQLAHGRQYQGLRTTSTIAAISEAGELGIITDEQCNLLLEGYRFLRRIEHRLRIVHDRSEHHLPADTDELDKLAKRTGYPDGTQLLDDFQRWFVEVHDTYLAILGVAESR